MRLLMRQTACARRFLAAMIGGGHLGGSPYARHEAAGVRQPVRRRGRGVAAGRTRAAARDAGDRISQQRIVRSVSRPSTRISSGLKDTGYSEGENVVVEYRWADNQTDRLSVLAAELVRRRVAVITAAGGPAAALAAKAATTTIPIVFSAAEDPVRLGLVDSVARPGGNLTGVNIFIGEVVAKRLELMRELLPAAARVAVLSNPADDASAGTQLRDVEAAARAMGLQIRVLNASTSREIDAVFANFKHERPTRFLSAANPFSPTGVSNWRS